MKRFLILLVIALMTISIIACTSSKDTPDSSASPNVAESVTPSISTEPSASSIPTESPNASVTPTGSPKASETPAPTESPKASGTSTPAPTIKPDNKPAAAPQAEAVSPKGKKVLFIGRQKSPIEDVVVADRLKALGFIVTNMVDQDFSVEETNGFDLIYFSQTTNSKILKGGVMKDVAIPTVYVKNHAMFYLGLSSIEENADFNNIKAISIVDSKHKVADGLSGTVDVYKETSDKIGIGYGLPGKKAKVIATIPGDKAKATIYYYDKGTKADNGYAVKARISYFFMNNGMDQNTTAAGWKLLDNIVLWTLQNG